MPAMLAYTIYTGIRSGWLDASYMINKDIGYIKLNRFSSSTMDEFKAALNELNKQGLEDLVLDLSGLKLFSTANSHAQDIDKRILLDFGLA